MTAALPFNETERLEVLHDYHAFATPPEPGFDRITSLAARTLDMPMAIVSLVGKETQWLKSCFGLAVPGELPRETAFCAHTILSNEILVVEDAALDPRFSGNPMVLGDPKIRFYAGCPLTTPSGHNVGSLCVIDVEPRVATDEMRFALRDLAALVIDQLELRRWMLDEESRQRHNAETNYRRLAECIHGMVFRVRLTSPNDFEYLYVSPGSVELLGVVPEVFLKNRSAFAERIHPEDLRSFHEASDAIWRDGSSWNWTGRMFTADRTIRWVRGEGRFERCSDGSAIVEGLVVDISEEKHREATLSSSKDTAERGSMAKSEFLSRMSHEFRTPMNAILGFAQMLEMASLENEAKEDLAQIKMAGEHLLSLINEVLDLSSVDARRIALSVEPILLDELLSETVSLLRPIMESSNIQMVTLDVPSDICVLADRHRLKQVLINLLTNAVKYNRFGGKVVLTTRTTEGSVFLDITDEGAGIAPENIERIFTPFDRLGLEGTGIEGSGLGLSISRGLLDLMNGSLSVSSADGDGSTFTVRLPESVCQNIAPIDCPVEVPFVSPASGAKEILYIEDNDSNILLVQRILGKRPEVRLTTAKTLAAGLQRLSDSMPGLLLLDLNLPDGSGETIIRWVRTESDYKTLPIVVLSADATPRQAEKILAAGADHYLTKPLQVLTFLDVLDAVMREPNQ